MGSSTIRTKKVTLDGAPTNLGLPQNVRWLEFWPETKQDIEVRHNSGDAFVVHPKDLRVYFTPWCPDPLDASKTEVKGTGNLYIKYVV